MLGMSTAPARLKYTIYQGATFRRRFRWCSCPYATKVVNGVLVNAATGRPVPDSDMEPVDLTGCTARMQIRARVLAPDVLLDLTSGNGRIDLSDGADGWVAFVISAEDSADLPYGDSPPTTWKSGVGQLEIVHPDDTVSRVAEVQWTLDPEGTR